MAFPVQKILFTLVACLFFCGLQVDCKVTKYVLSVTENGTKVNQEIEVDVDEQTEVIRVPKHNNVDSLEILNDFNKGFSARRDPDNKVCYVSKLDSSFPSPGKMKVDMDQASNESQIVEEKTESSEWKVSGFANRKALPPKISNFCDPFPIFEAEKEGKAVQNQASGKTRTNRYVRYDSCYRRYCYYVVRCSYSYSWWGRRRRRCYRKHYVNYIRTFCCPVYYPFY